MDSSVLNQRCIYKLFPDKSSVGSIMGLRCQKKNSWLEIHQKIYEAWLPVKQVPKII